MRANPWKIHTDTIEHYKVYQVVHGLSTGVYTNDDARNKLKNIDLSDLNDFRPHITKIIKNILKEDKLITKTVDKTAIPVETEVAKVEKEKVVEKAFVPRKRNFKSEVE
jgi:hypothetical protein